MQGSATLCCATAACHRAACCTLVRMRLGATPSRQRLAALVLLLLVSTGLVTMHVGSTTPMQAAMLSAGVAPGPAAPAHLDAGVPAAAATAQTALSGALSLAQGVASQVGAGPLLAAFDAAPGGHLMTMLACVAVLSVVALLVLAGVRHGPGSALRPPPPGPWGRAVAVVPAPPSTHRAALAALGISRT